MLQSSLEKLANAVAHDPDFAVHVTDALNLKSNLTYVDTNLALKADKTTTYTKTETDTSLTLKANLAYVDTNLALKSNITYVDTNLALKADKSTTYTKTDIDTSLGLKSKYYVG